MRRKSPPAAKATTTRPPEWWSPPGEPLHLDEFGPNESMPHTWANTAYKAVPAMSRDELRAELERMDANILPAAEWVETFSQLPPHATLTAAGDPLESIRDLVRLRALLPRIRHWLELGVQGSSTLASAAPAGLRSYASRLAGLIMQIDGEAWRAAACRQYRTYWQPSDAEWRQAESDFRAELERRLCDTFLHCLTRGPHLVGAAATPTDQIVVGSETSDPANADGRAPGASSGHPGEG